MSASRPRAVRVDAEPSPMLAASIGVIDWCDAFQIRLPHGSSLDPGCWRQELFGNSRPRRRVSLLTVRDQLVRPLGLKRSSRGGSARFPVVAHSHDEVVVGLDDRHLDFRTSLIVVTDAEHGAHLLVTTAVRRHNLLGKCYFGLVRVLHRLLVPRWTAAAVHKHALALPRSS